ncbi:MAG: ribbon-helix-helix protein, CopG family [Anaerolineae bacterium]|nr:ribbon-helix-helix protein, CopG family [Anaerolineae bacterium]
MKATNYHIRAIDEETDRILRVLAAQHKVSRAEYVRRLLRQHAQEQLAKQRQGELNKTP